ncbi:hypothetical protein D3C85_1336390 [compost metagenome]
MAQADPGAVIEQAVVVRRVAGGRIEAALELEAAAPAPAQVFNALQAPQRIRQAAIKQAAAAALPRHVRYGHAGIDHAVQPQADAILGGLDAHGLDQASSHQGGAECDSHDALPQVRRAPPAAR